MLWFFSTLQENEIVKGYLDRTFGPEKQISRAELTKIIINSAFEKNNIYGDNCFPDVQKEWFAKYICSAEREKIISGYLDNSEVWYKPKPQAAWHWQLSEDLDTSYDVEMYDIDIVETSQSTINKLHADGKKVICYFSAGSWEEFRDDADKAVFGVEYNLDTKEFCEEANDMQLSWLEMSLDLDGSRLSCNDI